jgi:tetraacyldisaccharide-1-P 4'-kinase
VVRIDASPCGATLADGRPVELERLVGLRVGLLTAIARPRRLVTGLARRGIRAVVVLSAPDHGPFEAALMAAAARAEERGEVDLWLATEKCAVHLDATRASFTLPLAVLASRLALPADVSSSLARLAYTGALTPTSPSP